VAVDPTTQGTVKLTAVDGTPICLALTREQTALAIGMESGKVEFNRVSWENGVPEFHFEDFLVRCTSAVRDIALSPTSKWAAVGSGDLELRLIEVQSRKATPLRKHDGGVHSLCFDPKVCAKPSKIVQSPFSPPVTQSLRGLHFFSRHPSVVIMT